jgi:hypothetical protein
MADPDNLGESIMGVATQELPISILASDY